MKVQDDHPDQDYIVCPRVVLMLLQLPSNQPQPPFGSNILCWQVAKIFSWSSLLRAKAGVAPSGLKVTCSIPATKVSVDPSRSDILDP